jgi:hypothetical protein
MTDEKKPDADDDDDEITGKFQLSPEDLAAIAAAKSKVVPNVELTGDPLMGGGVQKTPFTIENAPVAKSILRPPPKVKGKEPK